MGINMITEAGMKSEVVMEEKENMVTEMMIEIVVMEIVIPGTLKTGMGEMVIGMMITGEGAEVLITMGHEVGVRKESGRMMAILHHGAVVLELMIILRMGEGGSRGSFLNKILALHPVMKKLSVIHAALYIVKGMVGRPHKLPLQELLLLLPHKLLLQRLLLLQLEPTQPIQLLLLLMNHLLRKLRLSMNLIHAVRFQLALQHMHLQMVLQLLQL
jgi:hypothetical protein